MYFKRPLLFSYLFILTRLVNAQHQELHDKPEMWKGNQKQSADSNNILHAFKKGTVHGHFRSFTMATNNKAGLTDYAAQGIGGGIKFETAKFHGLQFGLSGFYIFNIGSANIDQTDSLTQAPNRYELALFDITDASNTDNIDRLEELYLKYNWKNSHVTLGKQLINTAFINLQDGRMRPTEVDGLYAELNFKKKLKFEGGILLQISPRSTTKWYKVAESIGVYSQGTNSDGTKGNYKNNLSTAGIGLIDISMPLNKYWAIKLSDVFIENILNSILLQSDLEYPIGNKTLLHFSVQHIRQDVINDGGNIDPTKTYFEKANKPRSLGLKFGIQNKQWLTSFNYNRITKNGRYQMPREWGRDPFFTFLPRERNEGLGDVHAFAIKTQYKLKRTPLKLQLAYGYYSLPAVNNFKFNKYGMPSYTQINTDLRYEFDDFLKGLELQLLVAYKVNKGNTFGSYKYVINKVDMINYNLVLNYYF